MARPADRRRARKLTLLVVGGLGAALVACLPGKRGRAGVGGDLIPTPFDRKSSSGDGAPQERPEGSEPSAKGPTATATAAPAPAVVATKEPTPQGPASQTHPFKGMAYGAFPLESSEQIFQTGLKHKRSYWKVLKLKDQEKYFVFPSLRWDPTWLSVCNDEASPPHELYKDFVNTLCKPGTSDAITMSRELALRVAKTVNDGLKYRYAAFYETSMQKWRVYPSPHYAETLEVCEEQKSGPLGAWCTTFLKYPEQAEKRAYMLFETESEARAMTVSFNALYGIR